MISALQVQLEEWWIDNTLTLRSADGEVYDDCKSYTLGELDLFIHALIELIDEEKKMRGCKPDYIKRIDVQVSHEDLPPEYFPRIKKKRRNKGKKSKPKDS